MRKLEEKRELLYVIRTLDVLMSSGVGLEAALHTIGKGGYGIISDDFSAMMKRLLKGTGGGIDKELKSMMKKAESKGYKRLLNTLYTNVTQNTDLVETLKKQGARMEEERTEEVEKYIEELGGVPETLSFHRNDRADYSRHRRTCSPIDVWGFRGLYVSTTRIHHQCRCEHWLVYDSCRNVSHWIKSPY